MTLKYENTIDHVRAFGEYVYRTSPTLRRSRRWTQLIAVLLYLYFGVQLFFGIPLSSLAIWYLVATAYLVFASYWHKRSYLRNLAKMYRETENKNFFCEHHLSITDEGISTLSEGGERTIYWSGIERIGETDRFTFVFLGSIMALVIPRNGVLEGDYEAFTGELKKRVTKNLAPEGVKAVD